MSEHLGETTVRLSPRVRWRAVADEGVLVHLESQRVLVVSEVGFHVVRALSQGARTVGQLAGEIAAEFDVEPEQARLDVETFLAELDSERAIDHRPVTPPEGSG